MKNIRVSNMVSDRGREVPNQFIIHTSDGTYFQSYDTTIARIRGGQVTLDPNYKCSNTTSKYRSRFLRESTKETESKIAKGEYKIEPLN